MLANGVAQPDGATGQVKRQLHALRICRKTSHHFLRYYLLLFAIPTPNLPDSKPARPPPMINLRKESEESEASDSDVNEVRLMI